MLPTHETSGAAPLRGGLSRRQLNMIALGGVIGAGLFVGSGVIIGETGPGAFITYALCGVLVVLVMRMLGEMATANPSTGSFADYTRQAFGGWAGFSVGWLYWYFWVVVVGFEAIAGGAVLSYWIKAPLWLLSGVLMVAMTATNLFSVAAFGEFEFWFAGVKVAAIVAFLTLGSLFVFCFWPRRGRNRESRTRGSAGDQIGGRADRHLLPRIGVPARGDRAVERRAPRGVALRCGLGGDGNSCRWAHHERGGAHGRAVVSELRALHRIADAVRAGRPRRSTDGLGQSGSTRSALPRDPRFIGRGLPMRNRGVGGARGGVHVPAEIVWLPRSFGLPVDRDFSDRAAPTHPARPAPGENVAVSRIVDPHRGRTRRRAGVDSVRPQCPDRAVAGSAVLGGGVGLVLCAEVAAWASQGRGCGAPTDRPGEPCSGAGQQKRLYE